MSFSRASRKTSTSNSRTRAGHARCSTSPTWSPARSLRPSSTVQRSWPSRTFSPRGRGASTSNTSVQPCAKRRSRAKTSPRRSTPRNGRGSTPADAASASSTSGRFSAELPTGSAERGTARRKRMKGQARPVKSSREARPPMPSRAAAALFANSTPPGPEG